MSTLFGKFLIHKCNGIEQKIKLSNPRRPITSLYSEKKLRNTAIRISE